MLTREYGQNIGFRNLIPAIMAGCIIQVSKNHLFHPRSASSLDEDCTVGRHLGRHTKGGYLDENLVEAPESETLIDPLCQPRLPLEEVSTLRRSSSII